MRTIGSGAECGSTRTGLGLGDRISRIMRIIVEILENESTI